MASRIIVYSLAFQQELKDQRLPSPIVKPIGLDTAGANSPRSRIAQIVEELKEHERMFPYLAVGSDNPRITINLNK